MSSQMATDAARRKRDAARDFLRSAVMPLIEEVLVKKFCQTMDVIAEENKKLKAREEGLVEALETISEIDYDTPIDDTDTVRLWAACDGIRRAKLIAVKALAAYRKGGGA